jgi:HAMP domain-containing protein
LNRVPPQERPAASEPEAVAESNQPKDGKIIGGHYADFEAAWRPNRSVRPPQGRRDSPPRRSLASFVWGWGLIVLGIIAFFLSVDEVSHTAGAVARVQQQWKAATDKILEATEVAQQKARADYNATPIDSSRLQVLSDAYTAATNARWSAYESQLDAIAKKYGPLEAQIEKTGAHITLALRVGAGLCALAGLIILSYWLATGGMRTSGVRLD